MCMRYLEEYVSLFITGSSKRIGMDNNDFEFLYSIMEQLERSRTLTTRQGAALKRIYSKYVNNKAVMNGLSIAADDLREAIKRDYWKTELRISIERRQEARYIGDNLIALSYAPKPEAKTMATNLKAVWRNKLHIVAVNRHTLDGIIDFIGRFGLEIDTSTEEYLALCLSSKKQISHFIATSGGVAVNVCDDDLLASYVQNACGGTVL